MRDIAIFLPIALGSLVALRSPWVGILVWTWISIMNPHRLGYALTNVPVAAIVGACTLVGLVFTREKQQPFVGAGPIVLLIFMAWMSLAYCFSFFREASTDMLIRVLKIDFMILVALMLLRDRKHIHLLAVVLAFSLGVLGLKGGLFTIATGGSYRVWGPEGSFIEGNNEIAVGFIVTIPLIRYVQMQLSGRFKWLRHALTAAMLLTAAAALGSQSRGALLGMGAMVFFLWLRGSNKLLGGVLMVVAGVLLVTFMPSTWSDRMNTIGTYQQDSSAMGRINAWWMAYNLACDNFFGGGYEIYTLSVFQRYAPDPTDVHAAHSIYFQVLGEQGFIGLFLFLLLWWIVWRDGGWLRKHAAANPETKWASDLGAMCQVSLIGYLVGGAFLSLTYFDLPYNLMVLVTAARYWVKTRGWEREQATLGAKPLPGGGGVVP